MTALAQSAGLLLTLLGIPTALAAVVFRPTRRLVQKVSRFLDDWAGESARPGVQARPGVMERLGTIETNQTTVQHESQGTREAVQRALVTQQQHTEGVLAELNDKLAGALEQIEKIHLEVTPNGGGSLKDQVTRLDRAVNPKDANSIAEEH